MTDGPVLVLLATRLRGRGTAEAVRTTFADLGGDPVAFTAFLRDGERLAQVRCRGEEQRWSLTPAGEAELAAHLAAETERVGRADLGTAYEAFLSLNREFLAAVSSSTPFPTIVGLVDRLRPILTALGDLLGRFSSYEARFSAALSAATDDPEWITSPLVDSVHTIWFELHEHLLATLGRDRTQER